MVMNPLNRTKMVQNLLNPADVGAAAAVQGGAQAPRGAAFMGAKAGSGAVAGVLNWTAQIPFMIIPLISILSVPFAAMSSKWGLGWAGKVADVMRLDRNNVMSGTISEALAKVGGTKVGQSVVTGAGHVGELFSRTQAGEALTGGWFARNVGKWFNAPIKAYLKFEGKAAASLHADALGHSKNMLAVFEKNADKFRELGHDVSGLERQAQAIHSKLEAGVEHFHPSILEDVTALTKDTRAMIEAAPLKGRNVLHDIDRAAMHVGKGAQQTLNKVFKGNLPNGEAYLSTLGSYWKGQRLDQALWAGGSLLFLGANAAGNYKEAKNDVAEVQKLNYILTGKQLSAKDVMTRNDVPQMVKEARVAFKHHTAPHLLGDVGIMGLAQYFFMRGQGMKNMAVAMGIQFGGSAAMNAIAPKDTRMDEYRKLENVQATGQKAPPKFYVDVACAFNASAKKSGKINGARADLIAYAAANQGMSAAEFLQTVERAAQDKAFAAEMEAKGAAQAEQQKQQAQQAQAPQQEEAYHPANGKAQNHWQNTLAAKGNMQLAR